MISRFARDASRAILSVAIIGAMPVVGFAQSADSQPRPWYERIEFGGDFRTRYEGFYQDGRTTRHESYRLSQRVRKRVEEIFGWMKTVGGARKLRYRGTARNGLWFELLAAAYNLVRMAKIAAKPVQRPPETGPV